MQPALKTTRPVRTMRSIADIVAIESQPCDALAQALLPPRYAVAGAD